MIFVLRFMTDTRVNADLHHEFQRSIPQTQVIEVEYDSAPCAWAGNQRRQDGSLSLVADVASVEADASIVAAVIGVSRRLHLALDRIGQNALRGVRAGRIARKDVACD